MALAFRQKRKKLLLLLIDLPRMERQLSYPCKVIGHCTQIKERMEVLGRRAEKASEDFDKLVEKYGPDLTVDEYLKKTSMD